jgi:malate dehydrogenase
MEEVAIIGAGELGGEIAHVIARRDLVARVRLVDGSASIAAGKALDIMQAAPIAAFATIVTSAADVTSAAGASVVIVADQAGGAEGTADDGFVLMKQLAAGAGRAVIVCAGAGQRTLIERAVIDAGLPRRRVVGSAPEALVSAVRALTALEADRSPREIAIAVMGIPPDQVVVNWPAATIGGVPAVDVLDEPARRRITARIPALWPPGPYALAHAAADVVASVLECSRRTVMTFVAPDVEGGRKSRTAALPVRLDRRGIASVELSTLSAHAQVALDNAMLI